MISSAAPKVSNQFQQMLSAIQQDPTFNQFIQMLENAGEPREHEQQTTFLSNPMRTPPPTDVYVDGNTLKIKVDLPGVGKEHVHIEIEQNRLVIKGKLDTEHPKAKEPVWYLRERHSGRNRKIIRLPEGFDQDNVEAEFVDGVLCVCIGLKEPDEGKLVQVK